MKVANEALVRQMDEAGEKYQISYLPYKGKSLRYVRTGIDSPTDTAILFIHGAPGSLNAFTSYFADKELQRHAVMYSVDRLGYGYSDYGHAEPSIEEQAKSIEGILALEPNRKFVLVGHSFGAPIAAYLAYMHPDRVAEVFLLGAAVDPKFERFVIPAHIILLPPFRWISNTDFRVTSVEKVHHQAELKKINFIWGQLKVPVHIVHGLKDRIVNYKNVGSMQKWIPQGVWQLHTLSEQGHTFIFTHPDILKGILLDALDKKPIKVE